ncbi:hypothetical protein KAR91_54090 [Candidatus Pacearchaeota archaeon]|nr:hypothetical protein [Candidatus Pacearchaeota archaeon]
MHRIKELEFQRSNKIKKDDRRRSTLIASLSVVAIIFISEVSKIEKRTEWIAIFGFLLIAILIILNINLPYPENAKIQRNFDAILKNKKH